MDKIRSRWIFAGIALCCFVLLAAAWHAQYGPAKQQPCPLCILQRYGYLLLGTVCALGAIFARPGRATIAVAMLADTIASLGVAVAVWQVTKGKDMTSCTTDPVGVFVNGLPMVDWWPEFLFANGGCADIYPPVFGLVVPVWSMLWFAAFAFALALVIAIEARRGIQART